jgi:hypothetical protein
LFGGSDSVNDEIIPVAKAILSKKVLASLVL